MNAAILAVNMDANPTIYSQAQIMGPITDIYKSNIK
jgi:hypothetical protein